MLPRIPVAAPDLSGQEENYVVEAIRSTWISSRGHFIDRFEETFAQLCGTRSALSVCNGTVALHLALLGIDVRPGDEVLVPSLTYIATANAVRYVGAEPVFVDVDPNTWCLNPDKIEAAITRRTKGIIPVHLLGHPADMDAINDLASTHGLWVVEDAAEAVCAKYKGRPVGGLSKAAAFSFFGNKLFTCGEGGAVTVNDSGLARRMRTLRGQGVDPARRYYFPVTGYNFRLTNVACAFLCAQMERREEILQKRHAIYERYDRLLGQAPGIHLQPVAAWAELSPWMYTVRLDPDVFGCDRDTLIAYLETEHNIETRPMFHPLHRLPPFRMESQARGEHLPVTDEIAATAIMLPTYTHLTEADQHRVVDALMQAREDAHRRLNRAVA